VEPYNKSMSAASNPLSDNATQYFSQLDSQPPVDDNNTSSKQRCILVERESINSRTSSTEGLPHLVLYRLWIDPSVNIHQVLSPKCSYGFSSESRAPQFCINPYHYKKLDTNPNEVTNNVESASNVGPVPVISSIGSVISQN
ncbi:MAG: Mothers against decapentaplegic 2, partial [Paramarteilia canceri]